jgi:hypothetical protein
VASKILPNQGNTQGPLKPVGSAFGSFIFWLVVAIVFPYEILLPYWPEAVRWAPVALYLLAFFNLLRAALYVRRAVRMKRPNGSAGRMTQGKRPTAKTGTAAQTADRASRAEVRAAKDDRRNAALPTINRPPTVQRQR